MNVAEKININKQKRMCLKLKLDSPCCVPNCPEPHLSPFIASIPEKPAPFIASIQEQPLSETVPESDMKPQPDSDRRSDRLISLEPGNPIMEMIKPNNTNAPKKS